MYNDDQAECWLELLRDGTPEEQDQARTEIGLILEARGEYEEAARAYWTNVKARVHDPRPYYRLAAIHRRRGDEVSAARVLVMCPSVSPVVQPPPSAAPLQQARQPQARRMSRKLMAPVIAVVGVGCGGLVILLVGVVLVAAAFSGRSSTACADVAQRFPEWNDPEGAVQGVIAQDFLDHGYNPDIMKPSHAWVRNYYLQNIVDAYTISGDEAVAAWIAHSLYWHQQADPSPAMTLTDYVQRQARWRMSRKPSIGKPLPPDNLGAVLTRDQWAEMQTWPSTSCTGGILKNPENTRLVRLMSKSVGDTAWLQR